MNSYHLRVIKGYSILGSVSGKEANKIIELYNQTFLDYTIDGNILNTDGIEFTKDGLTFIVAANGDIFYNMNTIYTVLYIKWVLNERQIDDIVKYALCNIYKLDVKDYSCYAVKM